MKFYLLFVLLLCSFIAKSTPSTALASVEIGYHRTPPVEKKKIKKKNKKRKKRDLRKNNHTQQLLYKKHFIASLILTIFYFLLVALGVLFIFIGSFFIALATLILTISLPGFIIFGILAIPFAKKNQQDHQRSMAKAFLIITITFASLSFVFLSIIYFLFGSILFLLIPIFILFIFALIFLIAFFVYKAKLKKQKESALKKPETDLRAEVNYLEEKKIRRYLFLHENLTSLKVQRNIALQTKSQTTGAQRKEARLKIKDLDLKINVIKAQISALKRQNKIKKVLKSRK